MIPYDFFFFFFFLLKLIFLHNLFDMDDGVQNFQALDPHSGLL